MEPSSSNLTRNATDYPADISRNTEASHAEDSRNAASPPVNGLRNTDSPVTDSRYQSESNQIESDAQRAWEEKQAGRTDNRDSAPDAFSDPANEFNPFRDSGRQEEEGSYIGNIRVRPTHHVQVPLRMQVPRSLLLPDQEAVSVEEVQLHRQPGP